MSISENQFGDDFVENFNAIINMRIRSIYRSIWTPYVNVLPRDWTSTEKQAVIQAVNRILYINQLVDLETIFYRHSFCVGDDIINELINDRG